MNYLSVLLQSFTFTTSTLNPACTIYILPSLEASSPKSLFLEKSYVFVLQNPDYMYIGFLIKICNNTDAIDKLTTKVTIIIRVP